MLFAKTLRISDISEYPHCDTSDRVLFAAQKDGRLSYETRYRLFRWFVFRWLEVDVVCNVNGLDRYQEMLQPADFTEGEHYVLCKPTHSIVRLQSIKTMSGSKDEPIIVRLLFRVVKDYAEGEGGC